MVALTGVAGAVSSMPVWVALTLLLIAVALAVHDTRSSGRPNRVVIHEDGTISAGGRRGAPRVIAINALFVAFRVIAPPRTETRLGLFRDQMSADAFRGLRARLRS